MSLSLTEARVILAAVCQKLMLLHCWTAHMHSNFWLLGFELIPAESLDLLLLFARNAMKNLAARICAVYCWFAAHACVHSAEALWARHYRPELHGPIKDPKDFMQYNANKFLETGSIDDRPHHPDTHKVPNATIDRCCVELKQGYTTQQQTSRPGDPPESIHHYYTSIKQAVKRNQFLHDTCERYWVSPQHLLRRMHERDPYLKWRKVDYKPELTAEQMRERQRVATLQLDAIRDVPDYLDSIWWIDEVSIWFVRGNCNVKVYADAHDEGVHQVHHCKRMKKGKTIKVRALCAVNAITGPCFLEFTTGTTDLKREWINRTAPYMVSWAAARAGAWSGVQGTQGLGLGRTLDAI